MQLLTQIVPVDFNYFLFGDTHQGSIFHHKRGWEQFVDAVHTKIDGLPTSRNLLCEHGDDADFIDPKDPRMDMDVFDERQTLLQQLEYVKKSRSSLKGHYVCKLIGNHEFSKMHMGNFTESACKHLGAPYGGWSCKITFKNRSGRFLFKHYATHGMKGMNSTADDPKRRRTNRQLVLKRLLKLKAGDCVLMSRAHTHVCERLKPETDVFFSDNGEEIMVQTTGAEHDAEYIHPDLRWYVSTGSFYKQYNVKSGAVSYAERRDYDPLRLGWQIAKIRGGRIKSIEPEWMD